MCENVRIIGTYKGKKNADFLFELLAYHPGIPGYDVKYDFILKFRNEILTSDKYIISSNLSGVTITEHQIIVPEEVRNCEDELIITAIFNDEAFGGARDFESKMHIKLKKWEKTFEDNFDAFNTDIWSTYYMSIPKNGDFVAVLPKNSSVRDGKLCLDVIREDYNLPGIDTTFQYSRGYVSTKNKFYQTYGCFSARMLVTESSFTNGGIMCSFWLMPEGKYKENYFFQRIDTDEFWGCSEIDILEGYKMSRGGSQHTEHWWAEDGTYRGQTPKFYKTPSYTIGSWHEFSFVWTEYGVYYYVDGELAVYNDNIVPVDNPVPAHIIFGTAVSPKGHPGWTGVLESDDELPQTSYIDWVKVYK